MRIRELPLVAVPMTQGGDVLFPGGTRVLRAKGEERKRLESLEGEVAYVPVDAWGEMVDVGTVALVGGKREMGEEMTIVLMGRKRCWVGEGGENVKVEEFGDEHVGEDEEKILDNVEAEVVEKMKELVKLTIKTSDRERGERLAEVLSMVEKCWEERVGQEEGESGHWVMDVGKEQRRELLGFVVLDQVSMSFMERRKCVRDTNTHERLKKALEWLQPYVNELAAKGAIVSALGSSDDSSDDLS